MRNLLLAVVALGLIASPVLAQGKPPKKFDPPKLEKPEEPAHLEWQHPYGDDTFLPCVHRGAQHPNGDPTTIPCVHMVARHPGGDPTTIPCVHPVADHPGGDDTGQRVPCVHWKNGRQQHPNGDPVMVPCTHLHKQHPNGDTGPNVPCTHLTAQHPNGDPGPVVPCTHIVAQHPNGDPGPRTPCRHPVKLERSLPELGLNLYLADKDLQDEVIRTVKFFADSGIMVGRPRPFNVFNRDPIRGNPDDNTDPFWSMYHPESHSIQLTRGRERKALLGSLHHEIGHALLGHKCVFITTPCGAHAISDAKDAGLAMSEGWAHFVALTLENASGSDSVHRGGVTNEWEGGESDSTIPSSTKNEFRVGCILWDFFDTRKDGPDTVTVSFAEMFKVYSPTLATLREGPLIPDVDNYIDRLVRNGAVSAKDAKAIRDFNLNVR